MNRELNISKLNQHNIWDIVVIGGGASGLGTALEAASRGYKTIVVEQHDFAKSTSSRSTKLVHGGVRYLEQGDVALVLEALKERGILLKNAPHLVRKLEFVIPNYEWWGAPYYTLGLKIYDLMSGKFGFGSSEHISKEIAEEKIPNLTAEELGSGVTYFDGQFDDSRLAIALAQTIEDKGGVPINYMKVTNLVKNRSGMVKGVRLQDMETGEELKVNARVVINATGVFADSIIKMDDPSSEDTIVISQGTHLVVDKKFLGSDTALMIPKTSDGRVLFAVPWHDKVILGTTDTAVPDVTLEPRALEDEVEFILRTCARYMKKIPRKEDVLSVYSGLRPLAAPEKEGKKTKEITRGHVINISLAGLVSIIGGKWTTYRKIGEDAVDNAILMGGLKDQPSISSQMHLHGYVQDVEDDHLRYYGSDALKIRSIIDKDPKMGERIIESYPYLKAEIVWAVKGEMARSIEDFLARRIRLLFTDAQAALDAAPIVVKIMATELGQRRKWQRLQLENFNELAQGYLVNI